MLNRIKRIFARHVFIRTESQSVMNIYGDVGTYKWVLKEWAEGLIGGLLLMGAILVILALCIALQ